MKYAHMVAYILLFIGGINWGLIGLSSFFESDWDIVYRILGSWPVLENLVYLLVGASAVYLAASHKSYCKNCNAAATGSGGMM